MWIWTIDNLLNEIAMKKLFLYVMLVLGAGLSSCTTKDLDWESSGGNSGTVEVELPEGGTPTDGTSAPFPETPEGYQLRCILVSGDNRYEMVESESVNNKFYFTDVPVGTELYVWADFIEADAEPDENGRYADLYYDTQSMPTVAYVAGRMTDGSLFNNDACDAFYGHVAAGEGTVLTLKRPFAKVTYSNEDAIAVSGNIEVSYEVFNRFDIQSGTPDGTGTISYAGGVADRANRVWFSNYLFASASGSSALPGGAISMTADGVTKSIETDNMVLEADKTVNAHFNWADAGISITVDVGFSDPDAPRVGDYYYSDGTWANYLVPGKTPVGVVFATVEGDGAAAADDVANYEDVTFEDGVVHGWVVSLKEMSTPQFITNTAGSALTGVAGVGTAEDDIKGYANCKAWPDNVLAEGVEYVALNQLSTYAEDFDAPLPESGTSGWYIPAIGQLTALRTVYGAENNAVKNALQVLADDDSKADLIVTESGTGNYYWSSTGRTSNSVYYVRTITFDPAVTDGFINSHGGTSGKRCRPILTF